MWNTKKLRSNRADPPTEDRLIRIPKTPPTGGVLLFPVFITTPKNSSLYLLPFKIGT
jgi:hypothetical protein